MTADRDHENALGRWSRRKQEARKAAGAPAADDAAAAADAAPAKDVPAPVDPADLPDIDGLDKESDFTVFMRDGVPEELRARALRKLWTTDPVLANLDGLNDYDDDFGAILKAGAAEMRRLAKLIDAESSGEAESAPAESAAAEAPPTEPEEPGEAESESVENEPRRADPTDGEEPARG